MKSHSTSTVLILCSVLLQVISRIICLPHATRGIFSEELKILLLIISLELWLPALKVISHLIAFHWTGCSKIVSHKMKFPKNSPFKIFQSFSRIFSFILLGEIICELCKIIHRHGMIQFCAINKFCREDKITFCWEQIKLKINFDNAFSFSLPSSRTELYEVRNWFRARSKPRSKFQFLPSAHFVSISFWVLLVAASNSAENFAP